MVFCSWEFVASIVKGQSWNVLGSYLCFFFPWTMRCLKETNALNGLHGPTSLTSYTQTHTSPWIADAYEHGEKFKSFHYRSLIQILFSLREFVASIVKGQSCNVLGSYLCFLKQWEMFERVLITWDLGYAD